MSGELAAACTATETCIASDGYPAIRLKTDAEILAAVRPVYDDAVARAEAAEADAADLLYEAWAVIANASDWLADPKCEGEWVQAAIRWRDKFHAAVAQRTQP